MFISLFVLFIAMTCLTAGQAVRYYREDKWASALILWSVCLVYGSLTLKLAVAPPVSVPEWAGWLTAPLQAATPIWAPDALGWVAVALLVAGIVLRARGRAKKRKAKEE